MPNLLKAFSLYLAIPILISLGALLFLQQPQYSGVYISPSQGYNAITIKRDEYGVPTIESKTLKDTLYGLGYAHAQDRLWTLHFKRLLISGRLSEMFGSEGLIIDKFFRNLSLKRYSENATAYIDDESKQLFQAYADGINDYITTVKVLPLQFWIIWTNVENFTITDTIAGAKFLSFFLAMDFPFEFIYETLEELIGEERTKEIIPRRKDQFLWNDKVILNDNELKQMKIYEKFNESHVIESSDKLVPIPPERRPFEETHCPECVVDGKEGPGVSNEPHDGSHGIKGPHKKGLGEKIGDEIKAMKEQYVLGSNAWVIHGNHTTTGKPILASDPHLTNGMPSFWYNVVLKYDGNHVAGMSLPGGPGVTIGKTKHVAWGLTNLFADTSDIYTLTTKGENYYYENAWRPLRKIKETITVRGQSEPEEITLYESHHGVILDHHLAFPFAGMTFSPLGGNTTYVLAWIGFTYAKTAAVPMLNMLSCKTTDDIVKNWKDSMEPSLSFVFATTQGDIGYLSLGKIPVRRRVEDGTKPRDGSKKENDWLGFVPWEDQPRVINPQKGYIVSANNKISTDNVKWRVSTNLMTTSRAVRVDEMLREYIDNGKKISVDVTKKMQADTVDILAREVIPIILDDLHRALENEAFMKTVRINKDFLTGMLNYLKNWDFRMEVDSVPAGIFGTWQKFFLRRSLKKIGVNEEDHGALIGNFRIDHFVFGNLMKMYNGTTIQKVDDYWCQDDDHPDDAKKEPCLYNSLKALEEAAAYLQKNVGVNMAKWTWGSIHFNEYPHEPFGMTPLKGIFQRSIPAPGNARTVFVSGMRPDKEDFEGIWSPNTRMVASLKEGDKSYFVIDTGVSDVMLLKHYDDQMKLFYKNEYIEMDEEGKKEAKDFREIKFSGK